MMSGKIRDYLRFNFDLKRDASGLTVILLSAYIFSLLARYNWVFDLFSHFAIQYAIGGLFLGTVLFIIKHKRYALIAFAIAFLNIYEIYRFADFSSNDGTLTGLTIVQYNRNFALFDYEETTQWVKENANQFDVIVIQEASARTERMARTLKEQYPYSILEPRNHAFGMVVMSRYPFVEQEFIEIGEYFVKTFALRFVVHPPEATEPIEIFAVHAIPPSSKETTDYRNHELMTVAANIKKSDVTNIIMLGDWNLTPYSPYFADLVKMTGLKEHLPYGLPTLTWPSQFKLPIFQIPIDHIMYKGNLEIQNLKRGPAMGSDHYPVIASFAIAQ